MSGWKVGDTAYGIQLKGGLWMYAPVPFAINGVAAQAFTVSAPAGGC